MLLALSGEEQEEVIDQEGALYPECLGLVKGVSFPVKATEILCLQCWNRVSL